MDRARHYYNKTHKNGEINLYTNALKLVDTILNTKVNVNALAEAEKQYISTLNNDKTKVVKYRDLVHKKKIAILSNIDKKIPLTNFQLYYPNVNL